MYQDYTPFVNVSGIYFEQIDYYGHNEGAASYKVKQSILEMNKQFERLRDELVSRDMVDDVNIMVFSDHGMANVVPNRCIWLSEYIECDRYHHNTGYWYNGFILDVSRYHRAGTIQRGNKHQGINHL